MPEKMIAIRPEDRYSQREFEEFRAKGHWDSHSLAHYIDLWAAADPDRLALTDNHSELTRGELRAQAYRLALALKKLGVVAGDHVQVQLPNWNEFVVIYVALARIGAVLVPTMPVYRGDEVKFVIDNSGAKISIVTSDFRSFNYADMIADIRKTTPAIENVIVVRGTATATNSRTTTSSRETTCRPTRRPRPGPPSGCRPRRHLHLGHGVQAQGVPAHLCHHVVHRSSPGDRCLRAD